MSSEITPLWKKITVSLILAVGAVTTVRLFFIIVLPNRARPPETPFEYRMRMEEAFESEKANVRKMWEEVGRTFTDEEYERFWNGKSGTENSPENLAKAATVEDPDPTPGEAKSD